MRPLIALAAAFAFSTSMALAAPVAADKAAALAAGEWRSAAELGASAADIIRAAQAQGKMADVVPDEAVVTIGSDNSLDVVALKPLPPLPAGARDTANLSGSGFTFGAKAGAIVLYPADAKTFAAPAARLIPATTR